MRSTLSYRRAALCTIAALLALPCLAAGRVEPSTCWEQLVFEAGNEWATASTTLDYTHIPAQDALKALMQSPERTYLQPGGDSVSVISARFRAMRSHGELQVWIDPQRGTALQSRRTGYGRDSRLKTHRFLQGAVWRERRSPDANAEDASPEVWPLRSATLVSYPPEAGRNPVITPLMLLERASSLARRPQTGKVDHFVLVDTGLYRVMLESREQETLDAEFSLQTRAGARVVSGTRAVRRVDLRPHPVGSVEGNEAFSLLELEGEVALLIDLETGLPLRITGGWMRVGSVAVTLTQASLRDGCR
jgi:hypothetical protein